MYPIFWWFISSHQPHRPLGLPHSVLLHQLSYLGIQFPNSTLSERAAGFYQRVHPSPTTATQFLHRRIFQFTKCREFRRYYNRIVQCNLKPIFKIMWWIYLQHTDPIFCVLRCHLVGNMECADIEECHPASPFLNIRFKWHILAGGISTLERWHYLFGIGSAWRELKFGIIFKYYAKGELKEYMNIHQRYKFQDIVGIIGKRNWWERVACFVLSDYDL